MTVTFGAAASIVGLLAGCQSSTPSPPATSPTPVSSYTSPPEPTSSTVATPSTPVYLPPFIDHVAWTQTDVGASLQVYPTTSGRYTDAETAMAAAWREVVKLDPSADTPTMQAQFDCHWRFARIVDPLKTSWNLEPARPVVTDDEMISARCNPGGAEEGPAG